jgi:cyanate permease
VTCFWSGFASNYGSLLASRIIHSVVVSKDMGMAQGVRAFFQNIFGAASPLMIGVIIQATGGFVGVLVVLSLAIVISAGCMLKLALEGY